MLTTPLLVQASCSPTSIDAACPNPCCLSSGSASLAGFHLCSRMFCQRRISQVSATQLGRLASLQRESLQPPRGPQGRSKPQARHVNSLLTLSIPGHGRNCDFPVSQRLTLPKALCKGQRFHSMLVLFQDVLVAFLRGVPESCISQHIRAHIASCFFWLGRSMAVGLVLV